jgi:hypothetical protein
VRFALLVLIACKREPDRAPPPTKPEARTELPCAREVADRVLAAHPDAISHATAGDDEREAILDKMPADDLFERAKDDVLVGAVLRRIQRGSPRTDTERELVALNQMYDAVYTGGFERWLATADDVAGARAAIVRFAIPELLPLVDCALGALSPPVGERKQRAAALAGHDAMFEPLDRAFQRIREAPAGVAIDAYLRAHRAELPSVIR